MIFDEVQCGLGRTGALFASEHSGVVPDMYTLAKPLAGGFPMGAILVCDAIAASLAPGDHATTFGGGPFIATVALDVVRAIADPDFLAGVREKGELLGERLTSLADRSARVKEARGRGLMWGLELHEVAAPIVAATPWSPSQRSVATGPGEMLLMRIPLGPSSCDSALARFSSAAFAAP